MEEIFLTLLEISAGASVVIAAVSLFSSKINRTFVTGWKYWFWLVLAIRLLIPWNPEFSSASTKVELPVHEIPINFTALSQPFLPSVGEVPPVRSVTTMDLLWRLWLLGTVLFITWHALKYFHFRWNIVRWSRVAEQNGFLDSNMRRVADEMGIRAQIRLLCNDQIQSPLMFGFFHPVLVLPQKDYDEIELFFILRHELTHYRRGDIWYKTLLLAAKALHWFNPLVWLMIRSADRDLELSCDAAVVAGADKEIRQQYSEVILANIHRNLQVGTVLSTHFYGGKKVMMERFVNILNGQKRRTGILLLVVVLLCVLLIGGLVACDTSPETPSEPGTSSRSETAEREMLEAALEDITLEKYPHSDEETIEKFKEHIRSMSVQEAQGLMEDDELVAYMLNPFYWRDPKIEAALEDITLEKYPHSDEETIEKFKEHIRSMSVQEAQGLMEDDELVAYMLNPSYWLES